MIAKLSITPIWEQRNNGKYSIRVTYIIVRNVLKIISVLRFDVFWIKLYELSFPYYAKE